MNKLLILCILVRAVAWGQTYPRQEMNMQELLTQWTVSEELNYEEWLEPLYTLYQHPLDLNGADRDDLSALFFLNERQITELLEHRVKFGRYLSLYELQSLESFTLEDIRRLIPFVTISEGWGDLRPKSVVRRAVDHYLVFRADMTLEVPRGFKEEKYAGTRQRYYTRYRLSRSKDFSLGFISEKDPGEKNFLDYTAFHVQVQHKGNLRNLVAGDFLLQFGQGLVFAGGYAAGKGGEPVYSTRRSNLGIKPYNSLVENGGFRGGASTYRLGRVEVTGMISYKRKDASVSEEDEFSALLSAGMHRTEGEISSRKAIAEGNLGGNIRFVSDRLQVGLSVLTTRFDRDFRKRDLPYNGYEFGGRRNTVWGPNVSWTRYNFTFFAEAARSSSGGYGYIAGLVGSLGKQVEVSLNHRHYGVNFHTLYGNAFSEGSRTINERGVYGGLKYKVGRAWELAGYYDSFQFPWLKYRVDGASAGQDFQVRINYRPTRKFTSWLAWRGDSKLRNASGSTSVIRELMEVERRTAVAGMDYHPALAWKFQSKVQYNTFQSGDTSPARGWAVIQDVEVRHRRMQFKTRVAGFRTDSYDTRIYAYENDVLYAVSFPAYSGRGVRWYGIVRAPLGKKTDVWLRVAQTRVSDGDTLGSGWDLVEGNAKTDVRIQVRYTL